MKKKPFIAFLVVVVAAVVIAYLELPAQDRFGFLLGASFISIAAIIAPE